MTNRQILVFDRSPVLRILSCAASFASAALFFTYLSYNADDLHVVPMALLILLFLGTVAGMVLQYGDHIYFSDDGVMYENRLFALFGKRGRWIRWEDIVEIREVKNRVLILLSRDGRRMLVDALLGYAIARSEILRRAPQALLSGTLAED